jgi:hypothetical protein
MQWLEYEVGGVAGGCSHLTATLSTVVKLAYTYHPVELDNNGAPAASDVGCAATHH